MLTNTGMRGEFYAEFVYPDRTEVVDERNTLLNEGYDALFGNIFIMHDPLFKFGGIHLGVDVGDGTVDSPEMPTRDTNANEQEVVFVMDESDINTVVARNLVTMMAHIDGEKFSATRSMFTSATVRSKDGRVLAYKRFGGQAISSLIAVNIRWRIFIEDNYNE